MVQANVKYSEVKDSLKTGDLILFHGRLKIGEFIEAVEGCEWSHVGMVIKSEDIGISASDKLLLWESNDLTNLKDEVLNKSKTGPMLVDLYERMLTDIKENYDNMFKIRYLKYNDKVNVKEMLDNLKSFIFSVHTDNFPKSEFKMIEDFLEGRILNKNFNPKEFFCSELIAATYMKMGILPENLSPNSYEPIDFSGKGKLQLISGVELVDGPLINMNED